MSTKLPVQDYWFWFYNKVSLYSFQSSCLSLPNVGISDLNFRPIPFTLEKPDLTAYLQNPTCYISKFHRKN